MSCAIESVWLAKFYKDLLSFTPTRDFSTNLAQKICEGAGQIKLTEFGPLWIPFLQQFITVLEENSVPLTTPQYQQVFVALFGAYVKNYIGKEITKDSRSLERPRVICSYYGCRDCADLNAFLADPNLSVGRFSVNKSRRQHLHNPLDNASIDCSHITERIGSPQTLVVTKTFMKHDAARRQWSMRKDEVERELRAFPNEKLRVLLGMEYPRIFLMDDILQPTWNVGAPPPVTVPGPSMPSRARPGQKRKAEEEAEVIDLTGLD